MELTKKQIELEIKYLEMTPENQDVVSLKRWKYEVIRQFHREDFQENQMEILAHLDYFRKLQ